MNSTGSKRSRYRNGDYITLHTGCNSCTVLRINGVLCHESGCREAWKDDRKKCSDCGRGYFSPRRGLFGMCPRCERREME